MTMQRLRQVWKEMLAQSFEPHQWWERDGEADPDIVTGTHVMWVYRDNGDGSYSSGYFTPKGAWFEDRRFPERTEAEQRVHWLNGGK